ncbi:YVTN repeat-like/Quino protein amine dehydrogenase [Agrocybe pediades]|nr:YVTN repeat-like/Quino protein amine dehydrogenase [Agrocybe pediades]
MVLQPRGPVWFLVSKCFHEEHRPRAVIAFLTPSVYPPLTLIEFHRFSIGNRAVVILLTLFKGTPMNGRLKKLVKVPNLDRLKPIWSSRPSRDSQSALPTERATDPQFAPPTEIPTESHSLPPPERPVNSQSKPPTELGPSGSGSGTGIEEQTQNLPQKHVSIPWNAMRTTLRVLEKNSDGLPPLKAVVGLLVACLDLTIDVIHNREEYDKLALELAAMANDLEPYAKQLMERGDGGSVALIIKSINEELTQIKDKLGRGKFKRAMDASEDKDDIVNRYRKIDSLFRRLLSDITLRTHIEIGKLREATDTTLLRTLEPVHDARYNSAYSTTVERRGCTSSTREQILEDLRTWANDPTSAKVFWLNGMAGTGKTTILYSFCQWLEDNSRLGGNFFCSRSSTSCRSLNKILPSLAYQLAHYSPAFRSQLCTVLEDHQSPQTLNVGSQFKWVIETPFEKSKEAIPEGVVIVIDALDECENASETRLFLETLIKFASRLPVKFIIASRPEPIIVTKMQSPGFSPSTIRLHDIEQSLVEADIRKYLEETLSSMSPAPSQGILDELARRSGKLFIYAATVARYTNPEVVKPNLSERRLQAILDISSPTSSIRYREVDYLYMTILDGAFDSNEYEVEELENAALILRTVVCAMEPMSMTALSDLLALKHEEVENTLSRLQSVLHVQEGPTGLVSILHASFPDFLFDKFRSLRFQCDPREFHAELSCFCFSVMEKELRFNICGLETSFLLDSDVPDLQEKIERNISDALFYSCKHWSNHLVNGSFAEVIHTKLVCFLATHLLFWMEVLNVKRHIMTGPKILLSALNWLKENSCHAKNTEKTLYDAKDFVEAFSMGACNKSTPHIYISALPFCYKSNFVYENYWPKTQGLIRVNGSSVNEIRSRPMTTWKMDYEVKSLAFSHNGTSFATGSRDGVRIYDAHSGEVIAGPFNPSGQDPYHCDRLVAFSSDNAKLASVCHETICIWDVQTGNLIAGPLQKHTPFGRVTSLSFSSDSTKLVSGAYDGAIIVWDSTTGDVISGPLQESTASVKAVGFTPDDFKIVSVSSDRRISIWDAEQGTILSRPVNAPTWDGYGPFILAALSSDRSNTAIAFISETILIMDASTGAVVIGPFACDECIHALAFSHDGKKLFSVHNSGFRIWDAQTGTLETHLVANSGPECFAIGPALDGNKIISVPKSNKMEIEIWNTTNDGAEVTCSPPANDSIKTEVSSLVYSPDGRVIAAGLVDGCVGLWDAQTGKEILRPFQAHNMNGCISIFFSPDGANLATSFTPYKGYWTGNEAVRLWDARTGKMIRELYVGPSEMLGPVKALTYSHDGSKIAWSVQHSIPSPVASPSFTSSSSSSFEESRHSISSLVASPSHTLSSSSSLQEYEEMSQDDGMSLYETKWRADIIRLWDLPSGRTIGEPMQGRVAYGRGYGCRVSVVFSPDDTILISGVGSELIMWSIDACQAIWRATLEPAKAVVTSIAFSLDGTRFASGSNDGQLRLWNTTTREMISLPRSACINSIAFLSDGKRILTVPGPFNDNAIRLWDVETGDILEKFDLPHEIWPTAASVSPDCSQLAAYDNNSSETGVIRIWEVEDALSTAPPGKVAVEDIRSEFENEDKSDSTFYSRRSVKLAMSRIAEHDYRTSFMKVDNRIIFWVSYDFHENLCHAYNTLVIGPYGTALMDYSNMDLCIGKKWVNCWLA